MLVIALILLFILIIVAVVFGRSGPHADERRAAEQREKEEWKYGDVWKQGSPDESGPAEAVTFVEILRGDTGRGFDDSTMLDLISYLGSKGIRATFDSTSMGLEPAAIKTYVLKVEAGKEEEAEKYLREKFQQNSNSR